MNEKKKEKGTHPNSRKRKHPIHQSKAPTRQQGLLLVIPRFYKHCRRIKRDDVNSTHLLRDHDDKAGEGGASDPGDGEQLDEAGDVSRSAEDFELFGELAVDVVEVTAGLEVGVAETAEGGEGLVVAAFFEEPAG